MSATTKYLLVSLPTSISPSNDREEAHDALRANVNDHGRVFPFSIPELKMGTLDALVQQADDLAKLGPACDGVVSKIAEALSSILGGDQDKITQQKAVNDSRYQVAPRTWDSVLTMSTRTGRSISSELLLEQDEVPS